MPNPKQALQKAEGTLQEYNSSVPKSLFSLASKPHGKGMKKVKSAKAKDGGTFEVYERPAKAGQDRYLMYHAFGNGRGLDLGTHPSADGALKFARNNGIIEGRYDSYGYDFKDRWDGETPRATGRDYFGRPMRAEPEPYIFKDKAEAQKLYNQMARRGKIPVGTRGPIKNQRGNEVEWIVMVQEDIYEQIVEANSDKVMKQLIGKLKKQMSSVDKIDPTSDAYKKMIKFLDATAKANPQAMKVLADADVKFLSKLAKNRLSGKNLNKKTLVPEALKKAEAVLEAVGDTHDFKDIKAKINTLKKRGFKVFAKEKMGFKIASAEKENPSPTDITAVDIFVKSLKAKKVTGSHYDPGVTKYEIPYTSKSGLETTVVIEVVRNSDDARPDKKLAKDAIGVYVMA